MASSRSKWFLRAAGVALGVTGLAKAFSAFGPARALDLADPLLGIPFRHLMVLVELAELLIAFFCLFTDKQKLSLLAVAWLSTNFLVYSWCIGWGSGPLAGINPAGASATSPGCSTSPQVWPITS